MAKHRRGRSTTSATRTPTVVTATLPLRLFDVYLLTAESDGQQAVGGLTLVVDQDGLTVTAPHGTIAARLPWSEVTVLKTAGRSRAPDGVEGVLLEVSGARGTHRFIIRGDDPVGLEATVATMTGKAGLDLPRRARKRK